MVLGALIPERASPRNNLLSIRSEMANSRSRLAISLEIQFCRLLGSKPQYSITEKGSISPIRVPLYNASIL